jgi:hypothetical protein
MRWPETCKLIDRIKTERPELTVDHYATGDGHYGLRLCCLKKGPEGDSVLPFHLVPGSIDTIYGVKGWEKYRRRHPEPFCRPEESYHTDAMGREIDHRGQPVKTEPPTAPPITAEAMLTCIVQLGRADPEGWRKPEKVADLAAAWGTRTKPHGEMLDYEAEVVRLTGDCHASVLIARTGSGLLRRRRALLGRLGRRDPSPRPGHGQDLQLRHLP